MDDRGLREHRPDRQYSLEEEAWLDAAREVIEHVCCENAEVTSRLIWPRLPFPPSGDGRLLGKPFRSALASGWIEKDKDRLGVWRAYDHLDLPRLYSRDGVLIRQKALIPVYRSLIVGAKPVARGNLERLSRIL